MARRRPATAEGTVLNWTAALALGPALGVGAFVQGSIGFGMAVVAAPFIVVFAPEFMPVSLLITSLVLPSAQLAMEPRDIGRRWLGWALAGRVVGTPAGVLMVTMLAPDAIAAATGALILLTVLASVRTVELRAAASTCLAAGVVAGLSGTAASIGGPYLALVLQHERPSRLRTTLAAFFVAGAVLSLTGLALAGEFAASQLWAGLLWLPFVGLGYALTGPARRFLDDGRLRTSVLVFSAVAGASLIARVLLT